MRLQEKAGKRFRWLGIILASLGAWGARAQGQGILRLSDARGQVWDLHTSGQVIDGTNDTFDGGLIFDVNGQNIVELVERNPSLSRVEKDEIVIGPMTFQAFSVTRRIGLAADRKSLRLVTIIENRSSRRIELTIGHYSSVGSSVRSVLFSSGGMSPAERDHAVAFIQGPPRNSLIEVFGPPGRKQALRAQVQARGGGGSDDASIDYGPIPVPPKMTVAVVTFAIQTRPGTEAQAMREFDVRAAIKDLTAKLRRQIINLGGRAEVPALEVERELGHDVVCLASGTVLRGEVRVERYALQGPYGAVEIPAPEVIAIERPERGDVVRIGCRDGQIFAGRLEPDPLAFALQGEILRVPVAKIRSLGIRAAPSPPEEEADGEGEEEARPVPPGSWIALESGDLWRLEGFAESPVAITLHGDIQIDPARVVRVVFRGDQGPHHVLYLRSGSRLAGIIRKGVIRTNLAGGRSMAIPTGRILWAGVPDDPEGEVVGPGIFIAEVGSEERIVGKVVPDHLVLRTELGEMSVATSKIREVEIDRDAVPPQAEILLWEGSRLKGRLADEAIAIETDGFPLAVDLSRVERMAQPRPGIPEDARKRLQDLVERLDAPEFDVREEAQKVLASWVKDPSEGLGGALAVELESLLDGKDLSEEQTTRIRSILAEGKETERSGNSAFSEEEFELEQNPFAP